MPKPVARKGTARPSVRVEPVQRADGVEVGDERHLERDHQRGQAEDEERALEGEAQEGEGVGGQGRGDDLPHHDGHRHDGRGGHVLGHLPRGPGRGVVAPLRVGREERGRLLDQLVGDQQRVDHRHVDREEHHDGPHGEQRVAADGAPAPRRPVDPDGRQRPRPGRGHPHARRHRSLARHALGPFVSGHRSPAVRAAASE